MEFYKGWHLSRGFLTPFRFSSSFKQSFFGAKIGLGTAMLPPLILQIGISSKVLRVYAGQEYWFLETFTKSLNFSINLIFDFPNKNNRCMFRDTEAIHLGGFCEMLYRKEVELAGFPIDIKCANYQFLDPTAIYHLVHNRLISVNPQSKRSSL